MLSPKKVKYRKSQKGRMKGAAYRGSDSEFRRIRIAGHRLWKNFLQTDRGGTYCHDPSRKKGGKIWIRIFPDKPFTKKPAEVRMGKGKGAPEGWVAVIRPGRVLYEMTGVSREMAQEALRLAAHKLPVKTRFVERSEL